MGRHKGQTGSTLFPSILYWAIERYGSPEALVTDSGSVFLANRAKAIYAALGIDKHEIEKGEPWQNNSEAQFGVQKTMADHHFSEAASWQELVAVHDRWMGATTYRDTSPMKTAKTAAAVQWSSSARRFIERGGLSMSEKPGLTARRAYENARRHVPVPGQ